MPVVAMKVTDKKAHEKTDKLFIYTFESPEHGERTIVANLTNTYEVGDVAAVALEGTRLPDVTIAAREVFGVASSGMALGTVEAALDADLSEQFEADASKRTFTVTVTLEVDGHYDKDVIKAARKRIGGGAGEITLTPGPVVAD